MVKTVQPDHVELFVEVRLDIWYPLIALVPPEAPDHESVIFSLEYVAGLAVTVVGAFGWVLRRTELLDVLQPE